MNSELIVALVSGAVALTAAALAVWSQTRTARVEADIANLRLDEQRTIEAEKTAAQSLEPLIRAANDLQSRLYNILEQGLLNAYFDGGDDRERSYVVDHTSYVVAQYFAWTELVRRAVQNVDLAQDERTLRLTSLQDAVHAIFRSDRFRRPLRVFAGEQRAIGERMIRVGSRGFECMGYAEFLDFTRDRRDPLIEELRREVGDLSRDLPEARPRLVAIQHALIDLLAFLDPDFVRFPKERRAKVPA